MNVSCTLITPEGRRQTVDRCIRFSLLRERYQPFAQLNARFLVDAPVQMPSKVRFFIGDTPVHEGVTIEAVCSREQGEWVLRIRSRSYTAALTKNQLVPKLYESVTLRDLMETYSLPNITYDEGGGVINYVFVKDNTAMWDAIIAYNYKLCGGFPYVRVPNHLCMMPQKGDTPIVLPADRLLYTGTGGNTGDMISRIEMADAAGRYGSFTRVNTEAMRRGIVRVRQSLLDRQYLYAPNDAMQFRIDLSNRRMFFEEVRYLGYCGEDLEDLVEYQGKTARVSRILVTGNENGITTADSFYFDSFCNKD